MFIKNLDRRSKGVVPPRTDPSKLNGELLHLPIGDFLAFGKLFRAACWIVREGDGQVLASREVLLQLLFPYVGTTPIATSTVSQNQNLLGLRIGYSSHRLGSLNCSLGDVKKHRGKKIVEAMRDNTAPERFRGVKNDGKNNPKHKNGDHIPPRQHVQQNPARQVNAQKQQG